MIKNLYLIAQAKAAPVESLRAIAAQFSFINLSKQAPEVLEAIQAKDPDLLDQMMRAYDKPVNLNKVEMSDLSGSAFIAMYAGKTLSEVVDTNPKALMALRQHSPGLYAQLAGSYFHIPIPSLKAMGLEDRPAVPKPAPAPAVHTPVARATSQPRHISEIVGSCSCTSETENNIPTHFSAAEVTEEDKARAKSVCSQLEAAFKAEDWRKVIDLNVELRTVGMNAASACGLTEVGFKAGYILKG